MNLLSHQRKIVRFVQCDGIPLFEEAKKVSFKQTEDPQLKINKLLGIDEATFLKYFKNEPGASDIDTAQERINSMLGVDPKTFSKYFRR